MHIQMHIQVPRFSALYWILDTDTNIDTDTGTHTHTHTQTHIDTHRIVGNLHQIELQAPIPIHIQVPRFPEPHLILDTDMNIDTDTGTHTHTQTHIDTHRVVRNWHQIELRASIHIHIQVPRFLEHLHP